MTHWADGKREMIVSMVDDAGKTITEVAEFLNQTTDAVRGVYKRAKQKKDFIIPATSLDDNTIRQLMIDHGCDPDSWSVKRASIGEWGWDKSNNQPFQTTRVELVPNEQAVALRHMWDALKQDIKSDSRHRRPAKIKRDAHVMCVMAAFDLHVGKLAWSEEGYTDYDLKIVGELFEQAIQHLLHEATLRPIEQFVFPVGNDLLHVDNMAGTTTMGTPQDIDSRYIKMFRRARTLLAWAIEEMAAVAPVYVPIVPGNHDELGSFFIGEVLDAQFTNHGGVWFDTDARLRKYHPYGVNLLGFTHGKYEKIKDLPLLMSDEIRQYPDIAKHWSTFAQKDWLVGHWHQRKQVDFLTTQSFGQTTVRYMPSLSATDAWHYKQGYRAKRAAEAYLYDRELGYKGHEAFNVPLGG